MRFLTKRGAARAVAGLIVAFVLSAELLPAGGATPARAIIAAPPAYYPSGPQTSVNESALTGWTVCYSDLYNNSSTSLATILAGCSGEYLLLAAGPVGNPVFEVLAAAPRTDVIFDTGFGNTPHDANGSGWYYNADFSWGFALQGDPISRNSCDTETTNNAMRLCWHTGGGNINAGYRSGATTALNGSTTYRRVIYQPGTSAPTVTTLKAAVLGSGALLNLPAKLASYLKSAESYLAIGSPTMKAAACNQLSLFKTAVTVAMRQDSVVLAQGPGWISQADAIRASIPCPGTVVSAP